MPSNLLLLLPLLGGYLFIHSCYSTRFRAQALSGHRLIFEAAVAGFVAVLPAHLTVEGLRWSPWGSELRSWWHGVAGDELPATLVLALLFAPLGALLWNLILALWNGAREWGGHQPWTAWSGLVEEGREFSLRRALERQGDRLQVFLSTAAIRAQQELMLTMLSMKDRKVYVGLVLRSPNLQPHGQYVPVLPFFSGFRSPDALEVDLDREYPFDRYFSEKSLLDQEDFIVVLPVAEIASARLFEQDVYEQYFQSKRESAASAKT